MINEQEPENRTGMDALFMAFKSRKPIETVFMHFDQGCQFTSIK